MASEDITFCANKGCPDMKCDRNPKHIKLLIPIASRYLKNAPSGNLATHGG